MLLTPNPTTFQYTKKCSSNIPAGKVHMYYHCIDKSLHDTMIRRFFAPASPPATEDIPASTMKRWLDAEGADTELHIELGSNDDVNKGDIKFSIHAYGTGLDHIDYHAQLFREILDLYPDTTFRFSKAYKKVDDGTGAPKDQNDVVFSASLGAAGTYYADLSHL